MNKWKWMVVAICLISIALPRIHAFPIWQEDQTKQIEELKKQVGALEQRIATLESKLQKLTLAIPQTFPDLKQLPKGWEKREFNGLRYYIIPIEQEVTKTPAVIR
jgi:uncharacterized coiled-coil protein SlyX